MLPKKIFIAFLLTVSLNVGFLETSYAQTRKVKISKTKKRINKKKIVSGGVVNGKAINLVKPEYPPTAKLVKLKGTVQVQIFIDKNGDVTKAEAKRGHPFLIPAALKAARASKFEPFVLESGEKLKVSGVIVYNFTSDSMNWLELGFNSDSVQTLQTYLPFDFEEERLFLRQAEDLTYEEKSKILATALNLIENKLASDDKNARLFSIGRQLNLLTYKHWDEKIKKEVFINLQNLLYSVPANISPLLIRKIAKLISAETNEEFNKTLLDLTDKIYVLGN